jgi:excisionase family DNA binding protein
LDDTNVNLLTRPTTKETAVDQKESAHDPTHVEIAASVVRRRTLTVEEAGRVLGLGRAASYAAVKRGEIPAISIGRRLVVPVDRLERMLAGGGTDAVA